MGSGQETLPQRPGCLRPLPGMRPAVLRQHACGNWELVAQDCELLGEDRPGWALLRGPVEGLPEKSLG